MHRKCSFCGKYRRDYLTAYFHKIKKRLTICSCCIKKRLPFVWNSIKDEIEKLFLEELKIRGVRIENKNRYKQTFGRRIK